MRVTSFLSGLDTARFDRYGHRRAPNIVFVQNDRTFEFGETALDVVPKVPDNKLDSRIRRIDIPEISHNQIANCAIANCEFVGSMKLEIRISKFAISSLVSQRLQWIY